MHFIRLKEIREISLNMEDWTIVSHRRRHHRRSPPPLPPRLSSTSSFPIPWIPTESSIDLDRHTKLLARMHSTISTLETSAFYSHFLCRLRCHPSLVGTTFHVVAYGVGSIESYDASRLQVALAILLQRQVGSVRDALEVFDPVLSATECSVLEHLGCSVPRFNDNCRRVTEGATVFFMPHCEAAMYEAVLNANWVKEKLNQVVVLGNSFASYKLQAELKCGGPPIEKAAPRVVRLSGNKWTEEFGMVEKEAMMGNGDRDMSRFYSAFHHLSWHLFSWDDDASLVEDI